MAQVAYAEDLGVEPLCYAAQQCAEMALKALLIASGRAIPFTHEIAFLLDMLEDAGFAIPDELQGIRGLTVFATETRYVSELPDLEHDLYDFAVENAARVLAWTEAEVERLKGSA